MLGWVGLYEKIVYVSLLHILLRDQSLIMGRRGGGWLQNSRGGGGANEVFPLGIGAQKTFKPC